MADDRTLYVFEINEGELTHQVTDRFIGIVDRMREEGTRFRSSLDIKCAAYNDTTDELYTIPKYRKWIRKVVKLRPFLFYYLSLEMGYVHILGCLSDITTVTHGDPLTINEMERLGMLPSDAARQVSEVFLEEEFYTVMKRGIQKLCEELHDPVSEAELLAFLEYHHRESK